MKNNLKKVTSIVILSSVLFSTIQPIAVNAFNENSRGYNLVNTNSDIKLKHVPFWLMSGNERNATKDKQLCKIASSFDILNEDGTLKYTYHPQGCQSDSYEKISTKTKIKDNSNNNDDEIDNFLGDIFGDNIEEDKKIKNTEENNNLEEDIDLYSAPEEPTNELNILDDIDLSSDPEKSNQEESSSNNTGSTDNIDNTGSTDDGDNIDGLLNDLFSYNIKNSLISLKSSKFIKTIRDYSKEKVKIRVGAVEANILGEDLAYTSKVVKLLSNIDEEFRIDSIKNDLSKNISNVSYSLSTYQNTKDSETKKVFKNKLIKDLQTLKKKYAILKKKDYMISKTLEKRGQL